MSRELEALEKFLDDYLTLCEKLHTNQQEKMLLDKNSPYNVLKTYLKFIDNSEPSEALKCLEHIKKDDFNMIITTYPPLPAYNGVTKDEMFDKIEQALLKAREQEKENELLKEIIKSFFDRGCPLHQYTDKEGILQIEVDDECSIMHLGKFKDVDLDKKLKEVLE